MVSSGVTLTLWGEDASLTLVSHPSRDGGTIKIPYQGRCFIIQNSLVPNLFPLGWLKQLESLDETLREDECWWSSILTFTLFGFLRPDCIVQPSTKLKKRRGCLARPHYFEEGCSEGWGDLFKKGGWGCNFYIKNKLISEIFNNEKSL